MCRRAPLFSPAGGKILFDGRDITHSPEAELRPLRRRTQMIFQDPMSALNPRQRIGRILSGPVGLHMDARAARTHAAKALEMVGLPAGIAARYPHQLSGGQRQRVGIARASAPRPDFSLPTSIVSGLDVSSQAVVLSVLQDLVRELGLTLAFISHDLSVVRQLCDRTLVLKEGRIVEMAPTAQLFARPESATTRELLDAIPLPEPDQHW